VSDDDHKQRLEQLEARIAAAKPAEPEKSHNDEHYSQAHLAWRMVIELVVGLAIGFGIGYGLDSLFGTIPIFLVLFTLLGMAAGIRTMMRSAQEIQDTKLAEEANKKVAAKAEKNERD
jgi:ATP synthase protein I